MPSSLQWGHNFFVMEICIDKSKEACEIASFNGAITFSLWKLAITTLKIGRAVASMGP